METQLADVRARMRKINEAQAEIEREANLNSEGEFTADQSRTYDELGAQYEELEKREKAIDHQIKSMEERSDRETALKNRLVGRRSNGNSGAPLTTRPPGTPIEDPEASNIERTERFTIPASVRRVRPQNFHGVVNGLDAEHRAFRFGMFCLATLARCMPRYSFPQAEQFVQNYLRPTNTAHGESDAVTGGQFLVPEEFSSDLIVLRERFGVARRLFRRAVMGSDTLNIPKRASGLTAAFTAEHAAASESNMTWTNIQLVAKKLTALSRISNELNADAVISVGDELAGEMGYAFANKEDECGFNGDGTSTYGGINGIRNLLTDVDGAGTDSAGLVDTTTSNTWAAAVLGDFNNVVGKLPQYADTPDACWVCHRTFYYGVMQKLEMAAGGAQMMEIAQGDRRPRPLFMGYPVEFSQVFPSATSASLVSCILGDLKLGAILGDRQSTAISFSESATIGGESVFERGQIAVRGEERFDINVHGCGTSAVVGPIVGLTTGA